MLIGQKWCSIDSLFVLAGFIPPTSGTATVNGCDIKTNIDGVRRSLGLCPQHDILFDTLTVDEHLVFFAMVVLVDQILIIHVSMGC